MIMMKRDLMLLKFLGEFGVSTSEVLKDVIKEDGKYGLINCHRRLSRLYKLGLIEREKFCGGNKKLYMVSSLGRDVLYDMRLGNGGSGKIDLSKWEHDEWVKKVAARFYCNGLEDLISEKGLQSKFVQYRKFVPDFGVKIDEDMKLAVEVELHQKSQERIIEKFKKFNSSGLFKDVLYLVDKESVSNNLSRCYQKITKSFRLHIYEIEEFLKRPQEILSEVLGSS